VASGLIIRVVVVVVDTAAFFRDAGAQVAG
jgi:hypothetical protein